MSTFGILSNPKKIMVEQINNNVFRVKRTDLTHRPQEVFEEIQNIVKCDHCALTVLKRNDANINGSLKLIENIDNDYRSTAFVIVHPNRKEAVMFQGVKYVAVIDRYGNVSSLQANGDKSELIIKDKIRVPVMQKLAEVNGYKVQENGYRVTK